MSSALLNEDDQLLSLLGGPAAANQFATNELEAMLLMSGNVCGPPHHALRFQG